MSDKPQRAPEDGLHQVQSSWSPYDRLPRSVRSRLRQFWSRQGFNHDVASKLRYELDMLLLRARNAVSMRQRRQAHEFASRKHLKLHLGCGNALLPGWINVDCYPPQDVSGIEVLLIDMRRNWPLADGSATALFSEHFLEHLPFDTVRGHILQQVSRILEPGGRVRIGVPNGEYFIEQFVASKQGRTDPLYQQAREGKTPMTMLNEITHGYGHYFAYDFETMARILAEAGFTEIRRMKPGDTEVEAFRGLDRTDPWRMAMSLYVEAIRP